MENEINTDKTRLDHMEKMALTSKVLKNGSRVIIFVVPYSGKRPPTIREAIDLAIKEDKDE